MPHTLLIPLVGPMQAWGTRSRFSDRDTHREPTKSAVLGLICAALGRGRNQALDDLAGLRFGVRTDSSGTPQRDYQTAQATPSDNATLSIRHYLADARFLAGLESEDFALLKTLADALRNPVWTLSLGRKSYPLSLPPYLPDETPWGGSLRAHTPLEDALRYAPLLRLRPEEKLPGSVSVTLESPEGDTVLADNPVSFRYRARSYAPRRAVTQILARVNEEASPCIFPG
jgi:CRISPR system Cascade subunit CasD